MITAVELGNFLSHSDTTLHFDNGVTVFVGNNGSGKSSIIDAITFALFGQHTRKSNKGLIKRGTNHAFAKVTFNLNGKQYRAERKIDTKGELAAKFSENVNGDWIQIAAGERKQFGESMTSEVEKRIGLDFEKLKIASIVQQGELNAIIKAKPKEFKELLNAIIGIDKLDVAAEAMKIIYKDFRENIRENIGYDDTQIEILSKDLEKFQYELKELKPLRKEFLSKKYQYEKEMVELRTKFEIEAPKIDKINQLESQKNELSAYAKAAIKEIQHEINEKERKIRECEGCFEHVELKQKLEPKLKNVEAKIIVSQKKIQQLTNQKASLIEKQSLAVKLQLKDNKCPVCDSTVDKLNPLFEEKHLKEEIATIEKMSNSLGKEIEIYNTDRIEFSEKLQNIREAQAILRAHSIKDQDELKTIQREIELKKKNTQKIPLTITSGNLIEVADLDSHTKMLFNSISKLEQETKGFDETEFKNLKSSMNNKQINLSQIDQKLGAVSENISKNESQIKIIENVISELRVVRNYYEDLNSIQTNVFNRDGQVATSLRSWALNTISIRASEYLILLNTKIQRILLKEKTRDVIITCFSKKEVLDLESLSGGEQVSIALALRLGMASLLGASNLNLMILDEPTTHLDAERRKALVEVLSQLSNLTNAQNPMQFIIITHESEIFEDSNVEQIYKFESTELESKVTAL
ncbi:MAG: SMC family ATPase [Nitrosopumilaceae archaeon]